MQLEQCPSGMDVVVGEVGKLGRALPKWLTAAGWLPSRASVRQQCSARRHVAFKSYGWSSAAKQKVLYFSV